ncbi:MAG: hypothetical protein IAG10_03635 [Planctomycetaceae bacterium]|nr:hypothetical protein [Planctomycetaceae bacterium]
MSNGSLNVVEFAGSLTDLIRVVQKRVNRATDLIGSADDLEIIDREMRFIRPFWDFATARRALNSSRYWTRLQAELFRGDCPIRKSPLMWIPDRATLCRAAQQLDQRTTPLLINLLFGMDLVIFNFTRLLGRMKYSFGIDDPESFEIRTSEADQRRGYVFRNRCIIRRAADGSTYRVLTSLFAQPDGEEIKIEKDYSRDLSDPQMELRVQHNSGSDGPRLPILQYVGSHSEMKHRSGIVRLR